MTRTLLVLFSFIFLYSSCKKKETFVPNNTAKPYENVSTVKLENYINRLYIDLLGREPLDNENIRDVAFLRAGDLSYDVRKQLITRLMTDTTYVVGDSSYKRAYYQRIYDLTKARLLEGASDDDFYEEIGPALFGIKSSRLLGDSIGVYAGFDVVNKCYNVLRSRRNYQYKNISINQMYAYMLNNTIYDRINMNSLNFVNASYDDLFFRFPTRDEFDIAYDIIESGKGGSLFGGFATNKSEYCTMLTNSREFHEGLIKWCYIILIGREPTTQETYNLFQDFYNTKDLQKVQTLILMTDEYAHF